MRDDPDGNDQVECSMPDATQTAPLFGSYGEMFLVRETQGQKYSFKRRVMGMFFSTEQLFVDTDENLVYILLFSVCSDFDSLRLATTSAA